MKDSPLISLAREIATKAHDGQFRRDGVTPYIKHPEAVVSRLQSEDEMTIAVAWLHDVLEDTSVTSDDLYTSDLPWKVVDAVILLTKTDKNLRVKGMGKGDYKWYIASIYADPIARKVKIADMLSNLADAPTEKQIVKYCKALLALHDWNVLQNLIIEQP